MRRVVDKTNGRNLSSGVSGIMGKRIATTSSAALSLPGSSAQVAGKFLLAPSATLVDRIETVRVLPLKRGNLLTWADQGPGRLTRRSVVIGMLLVAFVAAFTPYNDYILQNTPFIG